MEFKNTSIFTKLAIFLFVACAIMLFVIKPFSAEFYITIFSMALMLIIIIYSFIKARKEMKDGK